METLTVVMPARSEVTSFKGGFVNEIFKNIPPETNSTVLVVANNSNDEFIDLLSEIKRNTPNFDYLNLGKLIDKTFAYAYLKGLARAVDMKSEKIIEMDATGAHSPKYIEEFSLLLDDFNVVLSTRFASGSGIDKYPLQRKLISQFGTLAANAVLGLGSSGYVSDMTSGYQAFQNQTLREIFSRAPIDQWISVNKGPGHFYQTEMRTYAHWIDCTIAMLPIYWGTERSTPPKKLPGHTVALAAISLLDLLNRRKAIKSYGK